MDESVVKFRVGVMVIATIFIVAILMLIFGGLPAGFQGKYVIYIDFKEAPGVARDTPVRKSGILIGRVTDVSLREDGGVLVTTRISNRFRLGVDEVVRINLSVLNDAEIQFLKSTDRPPTEFIGNGDTIKGTVTKNPLAVIGNLEGDLSSAIVAVDGAGKQLGTLAQNLNDLLVSNDDQINRIVNKTEKALDTLQNSLGTMDSIFGDEEIQGNVRKMLTDLPVLFDDTRKTLGGITSLFESLENNSKNLEGLTKPLGDRGEDLFNKVDSTVTHLDELLQQFVVFGKVLNDNEGSLGQLINNPDLYQHLTAAACNIEQLTRELKPIVRDARVFTDKISRHPETLGVRGAIKKNSGIK
jgi:phospholipid/cholesterol/gamma-HCH transport system substrate-binding protein